MHLAGAELTRTHPPPARVLKRESNRIDSLQTASAGSAAPRHPAPAAPGRGRRGEVELAEFRNLPIIILILIVKLPKARKIKKTHVEDSEVARGACGSFASAACEFATEAAGPSRRCATEQGIFRCGNVAVRRPFFLAACGQREAGRMVGALKELVKVSSFFLKKLERT